VRRGLAPLSLSAFPALIGVRQFYQLARGGLSPRTGPGDLRGIFEKLRRIDLEIEAIGAKVASVQAGGEAQNELGKRPTEG
jgi:hypothetical protein